MLESLKRLFGGGGGGGGGADNVGGWPSDTAEEPTVERTMPPDDDDDINEISSLSWDLRVQCFIGCMVLSLICSLAGSALLFTWRVTGFTVMVSLGSILSLLGTCFLMGPLKQLRKMFERGRFLATLLYLLSIAFTLIAGLVLANPPLALIFVIGQYIAMAWYSITYIPFARDVISSLCCNCFS